MDEIHRFNKAQQDAFLPFVEKGSIVLIGATTENPSFEINAALLSRCKVFVLQALTAEELTALLRRALTDERGLRRSSTIADLGRPACGMIASLCQRRRAHRPVHAGDGGAQRRARRAARLVVTEETLEQCTSQKIASCTTRTGEEHYNLISALHKSMRNSDPDAAVYWLARMLEAGEDPLYVARRVMRFASEDVGLADPRALEHGGRRLSGLPLSWACPSARCI